jgi:hypothetical protein
VPSLPTPELAESRHDLPCLEVAAVRWFQTMCLMSQSKNNISGLELKRQLGVCYRTAWLVKHKLMQVMREREADSLLGGCVIADDAYLGS